MAAFKKVHPGGAPPKLDRDLIAKICNNLRAGAYIETAVVCAGVSKVIFYDWMKKANRLKEGDDGYEPLHMELLNAVERAQEECVMRDLFNIDKCAMGQEPEYERYERDILDKNGDVLHAKGDLILNKVGNPIVKKMAITPDWSANAWRLERRHAKYWSRTEKLEHTGKNGGPVVTAEETEEEKIARRERVKKKLQALKDLDGK